MNIDDDSDWVVVDSRKTIAKRKRIYVLKSLVLRKALWLGYFLVRWYFHNNWKVSTLIAGIKTLLYLRKINISKEVIIGYLMVALLQQNAAE